MVTKKKSTPLDRYGALVREINGDSDRAAAVVGGAANEKALRIVLAKNGIKHKSKAWKLIADAKSNGLITPEAARQLDLIRDIRNDAGHEDTPFDFTDYETQLRDLSTSVYASTEEPFDCKAEFRRVALLAATALRFAAARPRKMPSPSAVDFTGIVATLRTVGVVMALLAGLVGLFVVLYAMWKEHPELFTIRPLTTEPDPSPA